TSYLVCAAFSKAKNAKTEKARWQNPGDYTVKAFLFAEDFQHAEPTIEIHVIKVELKDDQGHDPDGMKFGVTTDTKDRSRMLKAIVMPKSKTDVVKVRVSQGSALRVKNIKPGDGEIDFEAEGIG